MRAKKIPPHISLSTRVRVMDKWATLLKRGPLQSLIKWEDNAPIDWPKQAIVPNSWIEEERTS